MIGEIGGNAEEMAAEFIAAQVRQSRETLLDSQIKCLQTDMRYDRSQS